MSRGWIGVDLDGTLAHYEKWKGNDHIGEPIEPMLERVKAWLAAGRTVKIFTARANDALSKRFVQLWLKEIGLPDLEVTATKDHAMIELWDDRCIQVEKNTGRVMYLAAFGDQP